MQSKLTIVVVAGLAILLGLAVIFFRARGGDESKKEAGISRTQEEGKPFTTLPSETANVTKKPSGLSAQVQFPPHLEEVRRKYADAATRRDFDAMFELGQTMQKEAKGKQEEMAVLAVISSTLDQMNKDRRKEKHAPPQQVMSNEQIRGMLSELQQLLTGPRELQDPTRRHLLVSKLLASRFPDEVLPNVLGVIDRGLAQVPPDPGYLRLLNSFVGQASVDALYRYAATSYPKDVRQQALSVLLQRRLSADAVQPALELARTESDPDLRAALIATLADRRDAQVQSVVRESLADANPQVRSAAAGSLNPDDSGQRQLLLGALSDASPAVRETVLIKLSRFVDDPQVLDKILSVTQSDTSEEVRLQSIGLLQRNSLRENKQVLDFLNAIAANDPSREVRARALSAFKILTGSQ